MLASTASANDDLLVITLLLPALRVLADFLGKEFFPKSIDHRKAGLRPWREKANLWPDQACEPTRHLVTEFMSGLISSL